LVGAKHTIAAGAGVDDILAAIDTAWYEGARAASSTGEEENAKANQPGKSTHTS